MTVIALRNVTKSYRSYEHPWENLWEVLTKIKRHREWTALQPLSLEIAEGEVVGIVGTNGAGKSTLLKLIAGTLIPSSGEILVSGRVAALLELGAGFHPEMTGRENVYLGASVMGLSNDCVGQLYDGIVEFAGLGDFMDQPVKTYSSGMYMRLAFAVATAADPDVLILDETLSVGDGAFARKSFERIIGYKNAGKTILFCSHSLYQVEAICSRVLWLDHGQVVMDGDPAQVVSAYAEFLSGAENGNGVQDQPALVPAMASGGGRLTKVEVSADGVKDRQLKVRSGRTDLELAIGFESDPALPPPSIGLTITGANGWAVTSASTSNDGLALARRSDGSGEVKLVFPQFSLLKGGYWVNVFLLCEQGIHLYDRVEHAAELQVVQESLEQGVVSLPRRWSVNGAPVSGREPAMPSVAAR
ncbi:MAG: ABC transporter ATP-binding protein [Pseudomonadota bacterium]